MARIEGSAARKLEFDSTPGAATAGWSGGLRLAPPMRGLQGPDKYKTLDHRRHQAQIRARRILASLESD